MSKSIRVQLSKTLHTSKLEILLNSYTSLKSILSPNLSENNNSFMNSLFDLIISQLQIFVKLLSLNDESKIYNLFNSNNQYLSKQIATLYEFPRYNMTTKITVNTNSEKGRNDSNKKYNQKESYSVEGKRDSFHGINTDNFEFDFNNINTDSKEGENNTDKKIKIDINEIDNTNNNNSIKNEIKFKTPKHFEFKQKKNKFIKINKPEKEKNDLIKSFNFNNKDKEKEKEREKNIKVKRQKSIKKIAIDNIIKEKENNSIITRNIISPNNSITAKKYLNISNIKKYDYPSFRKKNNNIPKKIFEGKKKKSNKNKLNYKEYNKDSNKKAKSKNKKENENSNQKFKRKERKSKTVIYQTIQIPYLIDLNPSDNNENQNYISITFSNRILKGLNTPKMLKRKHKSNNIKSLKNKTTKSNENFKKIKKNNFNSPDYFSLDAFLVPQEGKGDEKLFFTKNGNVLINKNQKDILEDYVNNYLFEEDDVRRTGTEKSIKDKLINNIKSKKNKKFVIKGTSKHYNLKDVTDVLQILPTSCNGHIDDFYLRKKKASMFDRGIFKICHRVIDNYKKLEGKENIFNYKRYNSQGKYRTNERKKNSSNKNLYKYKDKTEGLYNKIF